MHTLIRILAFLLFATSLSSCRLVYRGLLGVDMTPSWKTDKQISKDFQKRGIPEEQRFVLDTASYYNLVVTGVKADLKILEVDTTASGKTAVKNRVKLAKDNLQPTQVRYFDRNGAPIFKLVNCYIDPPIPMRWNVEGCFDAFPPQIDIPELKQGNEELAFFLPHLKTLKGQSVLSVDLPESDFYAVVFWNDFMIRPSKRLIKTLLKYHKQYPDQSTTFLFVNNHNSEIWTKIDGEKKKEVLKELQAEQ